MDKSEIRKLVDDVASLVEKFFSVQNISGEGDSIPHAIARALRDGYLQCPRCGGRGKKFRYGHDEICTDYTGSGKIPFVIDSLRESNFHITMNPYLLA